jgi:long-chain fatty acid transport protein
MATRGERTSGRTTILLVVLGGLLAPAAVTAQEPIVPLQFSFSDPGARSMGFGGAFVALADDATAAIANPAGLVQLVRPEVSIEGRHWSFSTPFTLGGRAEGLPSGFGIDTVVGLRTARSESSLNTLSFLSAVYPGGRWSVAVFRHELANFEFSSETQGLFGGGTDCCQIRAFDQRVTTDLKFVSYGISGAYRLHERFVAGFGVVHHRAFLSARAAVFFPDDDSVPSLFAPNSYLPERAAGSQTFSGDDSDWGVIGGLLWSPSDSWRVGGVFRQGPEVALSAEITAGPALGMGVPPGEVLFRDEGDVQFPWLLGLGVAYQPPDGGLTVSFQWDHIPYSRILETAGFEDQAIDDVDEFHLGGEYAFVRLTPVVAVRAGVWWDPDHQVRSMSDEPFSRALRPPGEDQVHFTLGAGVAFRSFQVDFGVDLADQVNAFSVSGIYSF